MVNRSVVHSILTKDELVNKLKKLGVTSSMILEVHVSLDALPYVVGGAQSVVDALMELAKDGGTIMMDLNPQDTCDPSLWKNPSVSPWLYEDKIGRAHV